MVRQTDKSILLCAVSFIKCLLYSLVKHIRQVDGLAGCYRGLTPKLIGSLAGAIGSEKIIAKLGLDDTHEDDEKDDVELTDEES